MKAISMSAAKMRTSIDGRLSMSPQGRF
jgi:hypothetical protein